MNTRCTFQSLVIWVSLYICVSLRQVRLFCIFWSDHLLSKCPNITFPIWPFLTTTSQTSIVWTPSPLLLGSFPSLFTLKYHCSQWGSILKIISSFPYWNASFLRAKTCWSFTCSICSICEITVRGDHSVPWTFKYNQHWDSPKHKCSLSPWFSWSVWLRFEKT
jgi:hypothetical protein